MNKKQKKIFLISGIVLAVVIVAIIGLNSLSIVSQAGQINCPDSGASSEESCSIAGKESSADINGRYNFIRNEPTNADARASQECSKLDFLSQGACSAISRNNPAGYPYSSADMRSYISEEFIKKLGKQLIIFEGSYELNGMKAFKTYGLCEESGFAGCWVNVPEELKNITYDLVVNTQSIKILYKSGGYTEADFPECYNLEEKCDGQSFSYCVNEKFTSFGLVEGKCGYELPVTFYRLENDSCNSISLMPSAKTDKDYLTLEECSNNIGKIEDKTASNLAIPILIIGGTIIIILGLSFLYIRLKKIKR